METLKIMYNSIKTQNNLFIINRLIINTESISIITNLYNYYFKLPTFFVYWAKNVLFTLVTI